MKLKTVAQIMVLLGVISAPLLSSAKVQAKPEKKSVVTDSIHNDSIANIVNRNQSNVVSDPTTILADWTKKITLSGAISSTLKSDLNNKQTLSLSPALYLDAQVNDWILGHVAVAYGNDLSNRNASKRQTMFVEEAAITLANFDKSPLWLTAGRQYLLFGNSERTSATTPLTRQLSSSNNTAITAGYISPEGLNANIYGFQGPALSTGAPSQMRGAGANLGFRHTNKEVLYDFNLGYINNLNANDYVRNTDTQAIRNDKYSKKVDGIAAHIGISSGPVSLLIDLVSALNRFSAEDLPSQNGATKGAKPWAYSIEPVYTFKTNQYDSKAFIGYQQSGNAVSIQSKEGLGGYWMPQYRYLAGYSIKVIKNLAVTAQYQHDIDYRIANGGQGKSGDTLLAKLKLVF